MLDVTILDGLTGKQPVKKECAEYSRHIRQSFKVAFDFLEKHKHARTDGDWEAAIDGIPQTENPLVIGLICAVLDEIEREYKAAQK